jgi:hypothetical protein
MVNATGTHVIRVLWRFAWRNLRVAKEMTNSYILPPSLPPFIQFFSSKKSLIQKKKKNASLDSTCQLIACSISFFF